MDEMNQIFKGILLAAIGLIVIYESVIYSLLDIILLLGLLMLFIGIIMLISINKFYFSSGPPNYYIV